MQAVCPSKATTPRICMWAPWSHAERSVHIGAMDACVPHITPRMLSCKRTVHQRLLLGLDLMPPACARALHLQQPNEIALAPPPQPPAPASSRPRQGQSFWKTAHHWHPCSPAIPLPVGWFAWCTALKRVNGALGVEHRPKHSSGHVAYLTTIRLGKGTDAWRVLRCAHRLACMLTMNADLGAPVAYNTQGGHDSTLPAASARCFKRVRSASCICP